MPWGRGRGWVILVSIVGDGISVSIHTVHAKSSASHLCSKTFLDIVQAAVRCGIFSIMMIWDRGNPRGCPVIFLMYQIPTFQVTCLPCIAVFEPTFGENFHSLYVTKAPLQQTCACTLICMEDDRGLQFRGSNFRLSFPRNFPRNYCPSSSHCFAKFRD